MTTSDFSTLSFNIDDTIGILSYVLRKKDKHAYMKILADEMITCLDAHMVNIHDELTKYVSNKQSIDTCNVIILNSIIFGNEHTYTPINKLIYINELKFINNTKNNVTERFARLKNLIYRIIWTISDSTTTSIVNGLNYAMNSASIFMNKYKELSEIYTIANNINNACSINGSFTKDDFSFCITCLHSAIKLYEILIEIENKARSNEA